MDANPSHALTFDDVPFRGIVEQSIAGVYVVLDERFMYANDTFAAMFGYTREEFIGRRMVDCVTPDSVEEVMRNYELRMTGAVQSIHYFTKGLRRDGLVIHLELHASRVDCRGR
ncbi:MAG TPA: PAS domain S-box protein, partial [Burkholderiaceae bacterium]|nr:PAS domain S-box protein [Burkholderiaceae bacterium]